MSKILKRILIAEDSREWQNFHLSLLNDYSQAEIDFIIADSARTAIETAKERLNSPFDLIISDLQMEQDFLPDFAGEWFIKEIKQIKEYKDTPVVIISAAYNIGFIAHELGVDYLSKRTLINNPQAYYFMLDEKLL